MHIKVFDSQPHSYRDLLSASPNLALYIAGNNLARLNGMTRVRGLQDDAHLFCTEEQIGQEIKAVSTLLSSSSTLSACPTTVRIGCAILIRRNGG